MQKWEYKIIIGTYETYRKLSGESQLAATDRWSKGPNMAFKNITTKTFEELNTLGKEGWEVCAVTSYDGHSNEIYLKRHRLPDSNTISIPSTSEGSIEVEDRRPTCACN